jgi:hypothetical protein
MLVRKRKDMGDDIECIYLNIFHTVGYGGTLEMEFKPYLLLKDGTIYRNVLGPPKDMDIERSRQVEPKMWGRWQKSGTSIIVQWNDGERETWENHWYIARPAKKTDRLKGLFRSVSGSVNTALGGSSSTAVFKDLTFFDDGTFTREGGVNAREGSVYGESKSNSRGTYVIDGYTIELRYNNGHVERLAFYFYPDSNDAIGMGNKAFTRRK